MLQNVSLSAAWALPLSLALLLGVQSECPGDPGSCAGEVLYYDGDGDGYGDPAILLEEECGPLPSWVENGDDCDDGNPLVNPAAIEMAETAQDDDCDGHSWDHGAVEASGDCSLSTFAQVTGNGTRLRIIGTYEPTEGAPISVHIEPQEPVVLVLNSYDRAEWIVTEEVAGTILEILVGGDDAVSIRGPEGVTITDFPWVGSAYDWDDPETREIVAAAEHLTGLVMDSFHGCYRASTLTLQESDAIFEDPSYPQCGAEAPAEDSSVEPNREVVEGLERCAEVVAESGYCVSSTASSVFAFGLDTGRECQVQGGASVSDNSLVWRGDHLYACDGASSGGYGMLSRLNLRTGEVSKSYEYCGGLAQVNAELLAFPNPQMGPPPWTVRSFESFTDVQCHGPEEMLSISTFQSSYTAVGQTLYSAWHSTDEIEIYGYPEMALEGTLALEGYDSWIHGLSVPSGDTIVVNASWPEGTYRVHDLHTGALLRTLPARRDSKGLVCITR